MAIAQKWLAAHYNMPGFEIFDYNNLRLFAEMAA